MLDLHAPIEPGASAAGFQLGQRFSDFNARFSAAREVQYRDGFNLNRAINENSRILILERARGHTDSRLLRS